MGVNPFKIQTLGRWTSPLVVHYAGDALASGLADDLRPAKSGIKDAHRAIVDLVDSLELRIRQLEAVPAPVLPGDTWPDEGSYVCNSASSCWHYSLARPGWPAEYQRARCGWNYGYIAYVRQVGTPVGQRSGKPLKFCSRCLPELKAAQDSNSTAVSDVD